MADEFEHLLPQPLRSDLRKAFIGKLLQDVPTPAAVVDRAIVRRNCQQMLKACEALQIDFRPHVKTHKTVEVTRMQIGNVTSNVRVVVSTVAEAGNLLGFLDESKKDGKNVNILYGIPLPPSQVGRLARLGQRLGPGSISVLIDDIAQLAAAKSFQAISEFPLSILIKVDTGYHRAGLPTGTAGFRSLVQAILELESHKHGLLAGFYSHAGHSYGTNSSTLAMEILIKEIESLELAAAEADQLRLSEPRNQRYTLSVGATPTATSIESLVGDSREPTAEKLQYLVRRIQENHSIELHAGVYPYLDMQQLATHASPSAAGDLMNPRPPICHADLALTILVEVASVYESRDELEVLIAAGTLALGREPCKSYSGWGVVSNWGMKAPYSVGECGWKVGRISQEHGILTKHLDNNEDRSALLRVGQKLRIWPNHACVAGAGFSWYLVVDSSLSESRQDEIVDVWIRCRGW